MAALDHRNASGISAQIKSRLTRNALEEKLANQKARTTGHLTPDRGLVFISCGQCTEEETNLGEQVARLIEEQTGLQSYFAQNQCTLEDLTTNILGALSRSTHFIGIIHHRGRVDTHDGQITRASVWIEQEIAIAAFIVHILKRHIGVQLYVQRGISLEGMREKLALNPLEFDKNQEVLDDLKHALAHWKVACPPAGDQTPS
ncbi:MAG TPA: hypothetical protein VKV79_06285 [Terriglobia bacterium]|nr:hypothetical protein [Terriglobia bacterium]